VWISAEAGLTKVSAFGCRTNCLSFKKMILPRDFCFFNFITKNGSKVASFTL